MKCLGAYLACLISLVDSVEGQSLQNAQELTVFVLLESRVDELQRGLHAHKKIACKAYYALSPVAQARSYYGWAHTLGLRESRAS